MRASLFYAVYFKILAIFCSECSARRRYPFRRTPPRARSSVRGLNYINNHLRNPAGYHPSASIAVGVTVVVVVPIHVVFWEVHPTPLHTAFGMPFGPIVHHLSVLVVMLSVAIFLIVWSMLPMFSSAIFSVVIMPIGKSCCR